MEKLLCNPHNSNYCLTDCCIVYFIVFRYVSSEILQFWVGIAFCNAWSICPISQAVPISLEAIEY